MPKQELPEHYTAIAFDYGIKKIGVAVGESLTKTAKPLVILRSSNGKTNFTEIENIIQSWRPQVIIVGIPYNPELNQEGQAKYTTNSGTEIINLAKKFSNKLTELYQKKYRLKVYTVDEAHTSNEAKEIFVQLRKNKLIKQGTKIDDIAACLILERWFKST